MAKKHWMQQAFSHNVGGLHRATGTPAGKKIPAKKVAAAAAKGGRVGKMAQLAITAAKLAKR